MLAEASALAKGSLWGVESVVKAWKGSLAVDVVLGELEAGLAVVEVLGPLLFFGGSAGVSSGRLNGSLLNVSVLEL